METKISFIEVTVLESSKGSHWICSEWFYDGDTHVRCFNMASDYFAYIKPMLEDDVVLVVHNYSMDMINKLYNDALAEGIEL